MLRFDSRKVDDVVPTNATSSSKLPLVVLHGLFVRGPQSVATRLLQRYRTEDDGGSLPCAGIGQKRPIPAAATQIAIQESDFAFKVGPQLDAQALFTPARKMQIGFPPPDPGSLTACHNLRIVAHLSWM